MGKVSPHTNLSVFTVITSENDGYRRLVRSAERSTSMYMSPDEDRQQSVKF